MPETDAKRGVFTLKAATQAVTDEGVFEAVISTASIDRELDIVEPAALVAALKKWNRPIPLAWNHSTEAEDLIGSIEPMTAREQNHEVIVQGTVDLDSKRGAEAWRSFKSGTIGFSYGYLSIKATDREGGGKHHTELDVFEITATPTPMNNDTRVLSVKAMEDRVAELEARITELEGRTDGLDPLAAAAEKSVDPLEQASRQAVREIRLDGTPERKSPRQDPEPTPDLPTEADLKAEFRELTLQILRG